MSSALDSGAASVGDAERRTAEAEARFRTLADSLLQGVIVHDGRRPLFINATYARMLGYPDVASALEPLVAFAPMFPEDLPDNQVDWQRVLREQTPIVRRRQRRRRRDGSILWVDQVMQPVVWDGQPAVQVLQIDVTREVEAENELARSETRFRSFADESLQGIVIHDGRRCLFANAAYAQMMGFADVQAALDFPDVVDLVPLAERPALQREWQRVLSGEPHWSRLRELRHRVDGSEIWLDRIRGPVTWGGRRAIQVIQVDVSREVLAEAGLDLSEARFHAVIDNMPAIVTLKDAQGRFVIVNREFERTFGVAAAEAVGKPMGALPIWHDPAIRQRLEGDDRRVLEEGAAISGAAISGAYERATAAGDVQHLMITKFPVPGAGSDRYVGSIATDITALTQARRELEQREYELRRNQETVTRIVREGLLSGGTVQDALNAIVQIACKTLGLRRVGVWVYRDRVTPDVRECAAQWDELEQRHADPGEAMLSMAEYGSWYTGDYLTQLRHDLVIAIENIETDPMLTESGRAYYRERNMASRMSAEIRLPDRELGIVAFAGGPPRQWSAEDRAFARSVADLVAFAFLSERHFQSLAALDLVDQGIYVEDRRGDIIYANRMARTLVGKPDTIPERADGLPAPARKTDGSPGDEIVWRVPGGELRELSVARTGSRDAGAVTVIADVTERNRSERERLALERRMQQAGRLEAVGRLASGIAHDFNNLLGTVIGFASFLRDDLPDDGDHHRYAKRIITASEHGKEVVKQLLAFTRATDVERDVVDLCGLVQESGELLRVVLPASTRLVVDAGAAPLPVSANRSQLHQVLLNLCINASDALEGRPGSVTLSVAPVDDADAELRATGTRTDATVAIGGHVQPGQAYACVRVVDDGIGIDPSIIARVFDPFFTTKKPGRGTGLGLAVVHGIIQALDGVYAVLTRPGHGTTFSIYLPLTAGVDARPEAPRAPEPAVEPASVLVIDDEPDLLEMTAIGLRRLGYAVTAYDDPMAALAAFEREPRRWRVVVTDEVMPTLQGCGLIAKLRAIRPDCLAILCTGYSDGTTERQAAEAGAAAFYLKPVDLRALAEKIRTLLRA